MMQIKDKRTGAIIFQFRLPEGMTAEEAEYHIRIKPLLAGEWKHRTTENGGEFYRIDDDGIEIIKPYKA
jgi:hypothetical protein